MSVRQPPDTGGGGERRVSIEELPNEVELLVLFLRGWIEVRGIPRDFRTCQGLLGQVFE